MFVQNVGYKWGFLKDISVEGAIFGPSGQVMPFALDRDSPASVREILFDPQLYVCDFDVNPEEYHKLLSRFASYPWFGCDLRNFDSSIDSNITAWKKELHDKINVVWSARKNPLANWQNCVVDCVDFQINFGCSRIILPATLLGDPEDNLDAFMTRLDDAIEIASNLTELPLLASLPVDEGAITHTDFRSNDFIDALADQVSARDKLNGVYLAITRRGDTKRIRNHNVAAGVLKICHLLGKQMGLYVVVNYIDMLGIAAVAVGASAFAAGSTNKQNRFIITDYTESGGGFALPKFRSLELAVDLDVEKDFQRIVKAGLLRYLEPDETRHSKVLFDAVRQDLPVSDVAAWVGRNKVAESQRHCAEIMGQHSHKYNSSPLAALRWLQDAEAHYSYLKSRFSEDPLDDDGLHLAPWRAGLEEFLGSI